MLPVRQAESKLTDRYQTTVPAEVRDALGLHRQDRLCYRILVDGTVTVSKATPPPDEAADPVLDRFLAFLAGDMAQHPARLQAVDAGFVGRLRTLTADTDIDLAAPLRADDE